MTQACVWRNEPRQKCCQPRSASHPPRPFWATQPHSAITSRIMKHALPLAAAIWLSVTVAFAAAESFAGEYADKNYLHGKAVFQLSVEQGGGEVGLFFSAGNNDGTGSAPEGQGRGRVTNKGAVEF